MIPMRENSLEIAALAGQCPQSMSKVSTGLYCLVSLQVGYRHLSGRYATMVPVVGALYLGGVVYTLPDHSQFHIVDAC
ncbi:hypothetical protein LIPSTDRAFT_73709 [Lipomyces starkeyi NRRL Y-11557]|uniref:Uncharacterized protein n=1 Tax=Lipomyces starkeyi NRRL Y-11557 TaxID=675824 RepID=A0A1E3Q246_LIPST|nr:hypothetical protein LIPSTDRAFT_73709 [Lipomyces starkeyi NRRL Y-11557]